MRSDIQGELGTAVASKKHFVLNVGEIYGVLLLRFESAVQEFGYCKQNNI